MKTLLAVVGTPIAIIGILLLGLHVLFMWPLALATGKHFEIRWKPV